jgi:hypothetical protein
MNNFNIAFKEHPFSRYNPIRLPSGKPAPITKETLDYLGELDAEEFFSMLHYRQLIHDPAEDWERVYSQNSDVVSLPEVYPSQDLDDDELIY